RNCPVNESTQRTLKNFLENLKAIMQKKYSQ
uniref:Interleukin-4 n=2 Tax=Jaculus jaculus TaxID=51337 RepID=A0A8C5KD59_JACJA